MDQLIDTETASNKSYLSSPIDSPTSGLNPSAIHALFPLSSDSEGLWSDIKSMRWMRVPASSFKIILYCVGLYCSYRLLQYWSFIPSHWPNPFEALFFISHPIPGSPLEDLGYQKGYQDPLEDLGYRKGYLDLVFIAFYVTVWSFVRQSITLYILHPFARRCGIRNAAKLQRFGEQGYAIAYFSVMSVFGLLVMSKSKIWWYRTEHFWLEYPYWKMKPAMKTYYLLHSAYWTQQLLVLALRLEKPRKDYVELIIHHIVTLWLIGWSYLINLTPIGNAVFLSMDISDVFLALTKVLNYLQMERTKMIAFVWFLCLWTYFRHWLNLVILWSVWTEFDLIPEHAKQWNPEEGVWFPYWMKYQVFAPLLALQIVNIVWYVLIWRILVRALFVSKLDDERSDDENEPETERSAPRKTRTNGSLKHPQNSTHGDDKDD